MLFMVPLRKALIVKEHGVLPYPEGTACADVLLAGEEGGSGAKTVFFGMGIAALVKYIVDGMKVIPGAVMVPVNSLKTLFSVQVYPALMGVGYICGIRIASYMFAGAVLGWFVLIPAIVSFGGESICIPVRCQSPLFITRAGQVLSGALISDILERELWRQEA